MTKDKQIEEMAKDLLGAYAINKLYTEDVAEYLYSKGYRKSTDVAREIFEEIEKCRVIEGRHIFGGRIMTYLKDDIDELKKKYTEEVK